MKGRGGGIKASGKGWEGPAPSRTEGSAGRGCPSVARNQDHRNLGLLVGTRRPHSYPHLRKGSPWVPEPRVRASPPCLPLPPQARPSFLFSTLGSSNTKLATTPQLKPWPLHQSTPKLKATLSPSTVTQHILMFLTFSLFIL